MSVKYLVPDQSMKLLRVAFDSFDFSYLRVPLVFNQQKENKLIPVHPVHPFRCVRTRTRTP